MNIIIPMAGAGIRFQDAGYDVIKPLIEVEGKPIIEWVVSLFPGENNFIFICREDHLRVTNLESVLMNLGKNSRIVAIAAHQKGPVYSILQAAFEISEIEPCIVSYCDFFMLWDYPGFKQKLMNKNIEGAVPCYSGFHPHLIPEKNVYASVRVDDQLRLLEIKEKCSMNKDKFKTLHSPGVYYFKSGELLKHYGQLLIDKKMDINGEYYVSMLYDLMLKDHKNILVYDKISHFCQWGTASDLESFLFWISTV